MAYETIRLATDQRGVATLTLARPDKHNALSAAMIDELGQAAAALAADPAVRVVVLAAAGASFCAGADLAWMQAQFAASRAERIQEARRLAELLRQLNVLPKPLLGRVQGNAFGGGIGLMAVCDLVVASQTARFGLTETRLGLIPATIGPYVVARIGEAGARRLFLSARLFDAALAKSLGLVAEVVPADALDSALEAEIEPFFATAPGAVARAKALARALGPRIDDAVIAETVERLADCWEQPEAAEGIAAFFARRAPSYATVPTPA